MQYSLPHRASLCMQRAWNSQLLSEDRLSIHSEFKYGSCTPNSDNIDNYRFWQIKASALVLET